MNSDPSFKMSQDYELLPPQKKLAYPILIEEWEHLKQKIRGIGEKANLYHTIGAMLIGISGSALVAALTLNLPEGPQGAMPTAILVSWFIFACTGICGGLSFYFGKSQRDFQASSACDVVSHMELIERRYTSE